MCGFQIPQFDSQKENGQSGPCVKLSSSRPLFIARCVPKNKLIIYVSSKWTLSDNGFSTDSNSWAKLDRAIVKYENETDKGVDTFGRGFVGQLGDGAVSS